MLLRNEYARCFCKPVMFASVFGSFSLFLRGHLLRSNLRPGMVALSPVQKRSRTAIFSPRHALSLELSGRLWVLLRPSTAETQIVWKLWRDQSCLIVLLIGLCSGTTETASETDSLIWPSRHMRLCVYPMTRNKGWHSNSGAWLPRNMKRGFDVHFLLGLPVTCFITVLAQSTPDDRK